MATFYSSVAAYVHMALKVAETATSTDSNTSTVSWTLIAWLDSTSSPWYSNSSHDINVVVNGSNVFSRGSAEKVLVSVGTDHTSESNPVTIASGTAAIPHNSDGSKSLAVSFNMVYKWNTSYAWSASGSMALTQIARASQPSLITYPNTTQNIGDMGNEIVIHMNQASDSFTHTVRYTWYNLSGTISTNVKYNCKWTIPLNFANQIPKQTSGWGTIYADTYYNGTLIGTKSVAFTATVPASMKPTASITTSRPRTTATSVNLYVQNIDQIKVAVTASGSYGSSVTSISTTVNGNTYSGSSFTTAIIGNSGTISITTTVTDSRGRTNTATSSISFSAYSSPVVSASAYRSNSSGTADTSGSYMCIKVNGSVTALSSKNAKSLTIYYKKASDSSWTSKAITLSSYSVSQSVVLSADTASSYNVKASLADSFRTSEYHASDVLSASAFIDILTASESDDTKKGLAIGKTAETEGAVDIGWDLILRNAAAIYAGSTKYDLVATAKAAVDSGWVNITLESGITAISYIGARVRKIGNVVNVIFGVKGVTKGFVSIATIPDGYRPSGEINLCGRYGNNPTVGIAILANGEIRPLSQTSGSTTYTSTEGICFTTTYFI